MLIDFGPRRTLSGGKGAKQGDQCKKTKKPAPEFLSATSRCACHGTTQGGTVPLPFAASEFELPGP